MLDAGRAARQLPTLYVGATTALAGFEQGGHAALWAAELAPHWTPEQSIVAAAVAAPASEIAGLAAAAVAQPQAETLPLAIAAGLATTYPEALVGLGSVLTPAGVGAAGAVERRLLRRRGGDSRPVPGYRSRGGRAVRHDDGREHRWQRRDRNPPADPPR